jgi:hypothetical protein
MTARFTITLKAAPGIDDVQALRALKWLLKRARRQYGLVAVSAVEEPALVPNSPHQVAEAFTRLRRDVAARRTARNSPQQQKE